MTQADTSRSQAITLGELLEAIVRHPLSASRPTMHDLEGFLRLIRQVRTKVCKTEDLTTILDLGTMGIPQQSSSPRGMIEDEELLKSYLSSVKINPTGVRLGKIVVTLVSLREIAKRISQ